MNITTANWTEFKGQTVTMQTTNGDAIEGTLISLNTKGWNVKDADGRTITRTQSVVVDISTGTAQGVEDLEDEAFEDIDLNFEEIDLDIHDDEVPSEVDNDEDFEEGDSTRELSDEGHTTAELAEMFETTARELRKTLRKLGLGVGRGRRYSLTDADIAKVRETVQA